MKATTQSYLQRAASAAGILAIASSVSATATTDDPSSDPSVAVFAKRFACVTQAYQGSKRAMVYSSGLQMMVDPITGQPAYGADGIKDNSDCLPTVTAGCSNCPMCDDCCG